MRSKTLTFLIGALCVSISLACSGVSQDEYNQLSRELEETKDELVSAKVDLLALERTLESSEDTYKEDTYKYEDLRRRADQVLYTLQFFSISNRAFITGDDSNLGVALSSLGKIEDEDILYTIASLGYVAEGEEFENVSDLSKLSDSDFVMSSVLMVSIFDEMIELLE